MSTPLDLAVRKQGAEYHRERIDHFDGLDLDSNEAGITPHRFHEMRNNRIDTQGNVVTRSGYQAIDFAATNGIPLAKCEYVIYYGATITSEVRYDVTVFYEAGNVKVYVFDKQTLSGFTTTVVGYSPEPPCDIVQQDDNLVLTIYGAGVYQLQPNSVSALTSFTVVPLGKELCPTPTTMTFADTTNADLLVYAATNSGNYAKPIYGADGKPVIIRLDIKAKYWLASSSTVSNYGVAPFWAAGKGSHVKAYPKTRAWGYRFVAKQTLTDARGNHYTTYSAPSTDVWVEDRIYCPAKLASPSSSPVRDLFGLVTNGSSFSWVTNPATMTEFVAAGGAVAAYPTTADWLELSAKVQKIPSVDLDPLFFLAVFMGWSNKIVYTGKPYKFEPLASELKNAPLAQFTWNSFAGLPTGTTEVMIFRTAHAEPDDLDNAMKDPLFEPHKYGYVGSISNTTDNGGAYIDVFVDDVADTNIDFGSMPEDYEGYLQGQFTGQVLRPYQNKVALGNITTDYWVTEPTPYVHAYMYNTALNLPQTGDLANTNVTDYTTLLGDGAPKFAFYYSYIDKDGNESDLRLITVDMTSMVNGAAHGEMVFTFPRGYAPNITSIKLYHSANPAGTRNYFDVAKIPVTQSSYTLSTVTGLKLIGTTKPSKNVTHTVSPGTVIFTKPFDRFAWPFLNVEVISGHHPITCMEVLLGELWVLTDGSVDLTRLNTQRPRGEEESKHIGCISRFAHAKVDKVLAFLSQHGVYFAEASGVVAYPAHIHTAIREYLAEIIPGQLPLANARRASMGYLGRRNELWLHFPSSIDLWTTAAGSSAMTAYSGATQYFRGDLVKYGGEAWRCLRAVTGSNPNEDGNWTRAALPHRTFIYKFVSGNFAQGENYEFDLTEDWSPVDNGDLVDTTKYYSNRVVFSDSADGQLYCTYADPLNASILQTLANDTPTAIARASNPYTSGVINGWPGYATLEKSFCLGYPETPKQLREIQIHMAPLAQMSITTGIAKPEEDGWNVARGHIDNRCTVWNMSALGGLGRVDTYVHVTPGKALETKGFAPLVRLLSIPNSERQHHVDYQAMDALLFVKHNHPA